MKKLWISAILCLILVFFVACGTDAVKLETLDTAPAVTQDTSPVTTIPEETATQPTETTQATTAPTETAPAATEPETDAPSIEEDAPTIEEDAPAEQGEVWIPTKGGKKYHTSADCSNMIDPDFVSLKKAKQLGFTPCKRCYK